MGKPELQEVIITHSYEFFILKDGRGDNYKVVWEPNPIKSNNSLSSVVTIYKCKVTVDNIYWYKIGNPLTVLVWKPTVKRS